MILSVGCADRNPTADETTLATFTSGDATSDPDTGDLPTADPPTFPTEDGTSATDTADTTAGTDPSGGDPPAFDAGALLETFPGGCVPPGVSGADLVELGILSASAWTCALLPGRGNGSFDFDLNNGTEDTLPPGVTLDEATCTVGGQPNPSLPFGTYAWIVTFTLGEESVFVPYCSSQPVRAPSAYSLVREDTGALATLIPGLQLLGPGEPIAYGSDAPDPKITVSEAGCAGDDCAYAFVFRYNALSGDGVISSNPDAKFPAMGFSGFTHALRIAETNADLLEVRFAGRPWVVNVWFDYCVADNSTDCGNDAVDPAERAELIRENGGGTNYFFSLLLLPG